MIIVRYGPVQYGMVWYHLVWICLALKTTILGGRSVGRRRRVGEIGIKASTAQFGLNWDWG